MSGVVLCAVRPGVQMNIFDLRSRLPFFRLPATLADLAKHSAVYGLGNVLRRVLSIVLLPIYTRYLTPGDYGTIALLDLSSTLFALLVGGGMAAAVSRFHFDSDLREHRRELWWTGATFVATSALVLILPLWVARPWLSRVVLGPEAHAGPFYFSLVLPTMGFNLVSELIYRYLQVKKRSKLFVATNMVRLVLNAGLNLWLLIGMGLGVTGVLTGNLVTAALACLTLVWILWRSEGRYEFRANFVPPLLHFGLPFVGTALLSMVMHQADRYLLRAFLSAEVVGVYTIAYTIGQGVNSLCTSAFAAIWGTTMYEIDRREDREQEFSRALTVFASALSLVLFGVALFSDVIVALLTSEAFRGAAELTPIICLAYFFYSLQMHFRVPALLSKRSRLLVIPALLGAGLNILLNYLLIPVAGPAGAAWASVATFFVFTFFGLFLYRQIEALPYRLLPLGLATFGMALTYLATRHLPVEGWAEMALRAVAWLLWVGIIALELRSSGALDASGSSSPRQEPAPSAKPPSGR